MFRSSFTVMVAGVAAASLYAACRQCDVPRTLDEIDLFAGAMEEIASRGLD